ncbi:pyridoxal 5'-phosphate synthase glutaminase subunit PdxT [Methanobrevibacter olleyae]|uniref:Pyridoxal 5'-phosphate synthase subunit PdxT n=1 Tax=Methanobrevibacter olleyae TaxID=294671 RepID=A0A126QZB4_METOL|nr:pyridoxal 5'-phosphate synthase glutaminase subunit PdxT [Methanobrevibacter olleyae]AMK15137.1 glutamine amidotransferase subunit PdxT [Methanobrevibacter olleyae]SFL51184.1 5'-phosphate synthase pdxT subunit [Methanobrevibacter olleyae]
MVVVGILNLQGAVSEHLDITKKAIENMGIDGEARTVRYADEVAECDCIIISGGESTAIGKILFEREIDKVIKENDLPVFGTCAGMILLSSKTDYNQPILKLMDIEVGRNAFGRQVDSFEDTINILGYEYSGVFIRAPVLCSYDETKEDIEVLAEYNGEIVAIKQGKNLAISFHPELTEDSRIHEYFINLVLSN